MTIASWLRLAAITALAAAMPAGAQQQDPWAAMTARDLDAIHDTLEANHPGPVDPLNPGYRTWLDQGYAQARMMATAARGFSDYDHALRFYVNGFRDGHASLVFRFEPTRLAWPGFLVRRAEGEDKVRVAYAAEGSGVTAGAELVSCDGQAPEQMLGRLVDPYYWNADIPHQRWANLPRLFTLFRNDTANQAKACIFREPGGDTATVPLSWTPAPRQEVQDRMAALAPHDVMGLTNRDGIWFVTIPTFNLFGPAADPLRALIAKLKAQAPQMRTGTVVFDVRGNTGGNSQWADEVAAAFWGEPLVSHVLAGFDGTVDWRASPANISHAKASAEQARRDAQPAVEHYRSNAAALMAKALAEGRSLARSSDSSPTGGKAPPNPVTGKVYFLTDTACFSSCLQFADTLLRLPGVTHIGLPTDGDTAYLDNNQIDLPSGLGAFSYSMKVYRGKARKNNEWYEPKVRWPGGPMTDAAVLAWVKGLK
jgi:hypothetical protein